MSPRSLITEPKPHPGHLCGPSAKPSLMPVLCSLFCCQICSSFDNWGLFQGSSSVFTAKLVKGAETLCRVLRKTSLLYTPILRRNVERRCPWPWPEFPKQRVCVCVCQFSSVHFSSVAQSCPTLCNPMNRSTPGLPVHHQLPEFTQTHIR